MSKTRGQRFILTAMILMVGLGVFILHAKVGSTTSGGESGEVRMAVDPTVLPAVQPPGDEKSVPTEPAPEAEAEEPAVPEVQAKPEPAPKPAPAPVAKPTPAPAANAKPASTAAAKPAANAKPAPRPDPKATDKGAVTNIALDATDNEFVLTVTGTRPVGDTTYMNLNNPRRLVIDLREPWVLKTKNVIRPSSGAVKHVVVGTHPDRLRLVVHFNTPPKGRLAPQFVRSGNKLIVSVAMP